MNLTRSLILYFLLQFVVSCKESPVTPQESTAWQKLELFENQAVRYLKAVNGKLLVSVEDATTYRETPGRGKLYMTEDGVNWKLVKTTSWYAGPITFYKNKYYWAADSIHFTADFKNWDAIVMKNEDGSILRKTPHMLTDIVWQHDVLYGSEVSGGTFIIRNNENTERVYFNDNRYAGARRHYTIAQDEIIAIQNGGYTVYSDRPFIFRVPDGEFIEGDFVPDSTTSIASSTAYQYHNSTHYIASNFPEIIRVFEDEKWIGITDTIPTTKYLEYYQNYVINWALYIEFLKDELYVGTRLGGVMKWDGLKEEWITVRDGLPLRDMGDSPIDDLYYPIQHFEEFNGMLFAGFGFLEASSDPVQIPLKNQGLFKYQPEL